MSSPDPTTIEGNAPWQARHTEIVVRKIIADILHSRPTFYTVSGLQGEVDGHGDNRISKKVIEICKRIA